MDVDSKDEEMQLQAGNELEMAEKFCNPQVDQLILQEALTQRMQEQEYSSQDPALTPVLDLPAL